MVYGSQLNLPVWVLTKREVKMVGYWPRYGPRRSQGLQTRKKKRKKRKEKRQYPAILTEQSWI